MVNLSTAAGSLGIMHVSLSETTMYVYVPDQKHIVIQYSVHPVYSLKNAYPTYSLSKRPK